MKNYQILLIDVDHTLLDFDKAEERGLRTTFEDNGLVFNDKIYRTYLDYNEMMWKRIESGELTMNEFALNHFQGILSLLPPSIDRIKLEKDYLVQLSRGGYLMKDADVVCKALKKEKRLFIASNGYYDIQRSRLEAAELLDCFEDLYVSDRIGHSKPSRLFFDRILNDLNVTDRSGVLMIGDSLSSDIQGGFNAGIDTCWINNGGRCITNDAEPTYVVDGLMDLLEIMKG